MNAQTVEQHYHQAVAERRYADALELATHYFEVFPPHAQRVVYFWRMDMACKVGDARQALQVLRAAVDAEHWFSRLDQNPTFALLQGSPEFAQLVALCAERRAEEMAHAPSINKVLTPAHGITPYPLVFALHGNSENAEIFAPHWQAAVDHGWLVSVPQSPQALGPNSYVWNDWDWVIPVLQTHAAQVQHEYAVGQNKVVLAGFSMGSGLAIWLALEQKLAVSGVIAVAPFLRDPDALRPLLAQAASQALRFYLVASKEDEYCYTVAHDLAKLFTEYGITHCLDLYDDVGHAFPPTFEQKLPQALAFIVGADREHLT